MIEHTLKALCCDNLIRKCVINMSITEAKKLWRKRSVAQVMAKLEIEGFTLQGHVSLFEGQPYFTAHLGVGCHLLPDYFSTEDGQFVSRRFAPML